MVEVEDSGNFAVLTDDMFVPGKTDIYTIV